VETAVAEATADESLEATGVVETAGEQVSGEAVETTQASTSTSEALSWLNFFKPEGIPYALLVLIIMAFLVRFVSKEATRLGDRFADRRLVIQQSASFVRFSLYLMGLGFATLTIFDLNEQLLLAIGGTIAVSAGFAMKDLVASLIAGVIILIDRPFQVGDRVTFGGYYGEVTHIGLRSVRMMTLDDTQVTVPNNMFLTEPVASGNAGAVDMMIQVKLYIGADQNLDEARRLLGEVVTTSRYVNLNRNWNVGVSQVIENDYYATQLRAKAYVLDARLEKAFESDITERALDAFATAKIGPPAVLHRNVGPKPATA
jgi:small-conductance mechanosensitive channel